MRGMRNLLDRVRAAALVVALLVVATPIPGAHAAGLPDPTAAGPHDVGYLRTTFTRPATLTGRERVLDSYVWYPAVVVAEPRDALGHPDAAAAAGRHPVVVFSHGGCAHPIASSYLTMALASWGFVVVTPSHPGDTVLDGLDSCDWEELRTATLIERVADVRAVLDALADDDAAATPLLAGHLDLASTGVAGWSSGGSTALVAGREDPRIDAVLSLAPDVRPVRVGTRPPSAPTMVMEGALDYYDPAQTALDEIYRRLARPRYAVELQRTGHFAFSDACVPLEGGLDCEPGTLTQQEAHRLVLRFAVPFLLRHAAGDARWTALLRPGRVIADAELRADVGGARRLPRRR
jgi:predicted dienelactone hydrolase